MRAHFVLIGSFFLMSLGFAQQTEVVDFKKATVSIDDIQFDTKQISGSAEYQFDILSDTDSVYLDAQNFQKITAELDNKSVDYIYDQRRLIFQKKFEKGQSHILRVTWTTQPKKALYFVERLSTSGKREKQVWTQGQGKYTSNWLPSLDDVNDKIEFDLSIAYENGYEVLANGSLVGKEVGQEKTVWNYDMQEPMSSYLVAVAIGHYSRKEEVSDTGVPLELYYYPDDEPKVEPTYRHTKAMFDFLEKEIGVPYPWQNYKQVPVKDFLYAGMENTTLTIFSDAFLVDSIAFNDQNYVTVNAHELAHQWFGDLVTATSGEHHWLQEGFATYYALLAERHIYGEEHFYGQLLKNTQELIMQEVDDANTSLLDPNSDSTTFYKKGAWVLHALREKVGDSAFREAVRAYLNAHKFQSVETDDFIKAVETASGMDLSEFVEKWLVNTKFPEDDVFDSIQKSPFIQTHVATDCKTYNSDCPDYPASDISDLTKIKIIGQIPRQIDRRAFNNSLEVRRAIAVNVLRVDDDMKADYESLLNDRSYITKENALANLWTNFYTDRAMYLEKMKNVYGSNSYNVRFAWLVFNLNTLEYQTGQESKLLEEMVSYTDPLYNFELRMNAFTYLHMLDEFEETSIKNLIEATKHHNWQFKKFAKEHLEALKNNPEHKKLIKKLMKDSAE